MRNLGKFQGKGVQGKGAQGVGLGGTGTYYTSVVLHQDFEPLKG